MEKLCVFQVLECNKVLYKVLEQRTTFPISVGLKIYKIMKEFDNVEEYVFDTMDITFPNFVWDNMTNEQLEFYKTLISQEIEVDFEKIQQNVFENNDKLLLTVEDVGALSIILSEK